MNAEEEVTDDFQTVTTSEVGVETICHQSFPSTSVSAANSQKADHSSRAAIRAQIDLELCRRPEYLSIWKRASEHFKRTFTDNPFGYECSVCDRLWFMRDLKGVTPSMVDLLRQDFDIENISAFKLCSACLKDCRKNELSSMSRSNGYQFPPMPANLKKLNLLSERLVSPRLPYMQIRRLRREGSYGIIGQVINIPVDVDTMESSFPRSLENDYAFNVNLKKKHGSQIFLSQRLREKV